MLLVELLHLASLLSLCGVQLFSHNDKLEELILSGNQLSRLESYIFPPLTSLKVGQDGLAGLTAGHN